MNLIERARAWVAADPESEHRDAVQQLLAEGDQGQLAELFSGRLAFGTAGLRAPLGPGPNRMNRMVVRQTTQGLLRWMAGRGLERPRVVIGYDARHGSLDFANEVAEVVAGAGGESILSDQVVPTPVLANAIRTHEAHAGVMITASHNPRADNGYKLYLGDGIQIIPPADHEIAGAIDEIAAGAASAVFGESCDVQRVPARRWIAAHREQSIALIPGPERSARVVYTAMHGVGGQPFVTAALEAGFQRPIAVGEQFDPDPDFPTVSFPNPEEPGAFDRVMAVAQKHDADVALANDPDADRLAAVVRPSLGEPASRVLTGDELGVLLADHVLTHTSGGDRLTACSVVSSGQLARLAARHGVRPVMVRPSKA